MNARTASTMYHGKMAEVVKMLKRIEDAVVADAMKKTINGGPDAINYGHVGDMTETARVLTELLARLEQTGEYAA